MEATDFGMTYSVGRPSVPRCEVRLTGEWGEGGRYGRI